MEQASAGGWMDSEPVADFLKTTDPLHGQAALAGDGGRYPTLKEYAGIKSAYGRTRPPPARLLKP